MPSTRFINSAYSPETNDVWLVLIVINHVSLSTPIRIVNNLDDIESNGNTYKGCPFDITLPSSTEEGQSGAKIRVNNVSQELVKDIRTIDTAATVDIQIIAASFPNIIETEYLGLELRSVTGDVDFIEGTLVFDNLLLESFPSHSFSPSYFLSLFA